MQSTTLVIDYRRLSTCTYLSLDKTAGAGIKKVDLPEVQTVRLALESGGVRHWELVFKDAGGGRTHVALSRAQTMWGPIGADDIMPELRACAAQRAPGT
jgi:hypothetical protein